MSATQTETRSFQTEVKQLLHLMVHALYSNKEVFLRELVSNASDAIDKLRFEAVQNNSLLEEDPDLAIRIRFDKDARTLSIIDNGIGMSRDEVIDHLGTIAKSGTKEFLSALTGDEANDAHLIGQFGVGFYSAFIVADNVTVNTRRAGAAAEEGVSWQSAGDGEYKIETVNKPERGTEIILHLKAEEDEFLEDMRLRNIIHKYSDHISVPIKMFQTATPDFDEDSETEDGDQTIETAEVEETVNRATAMWTLPKNKIEENDYKEFYKHISHDFEDPLVWAHNRVEGKQEYISLLYIPQRAPFDMWNKEQKHGIKLYAKRVFIMDDAEQFLPNYLRFVKGIVDSSDLPLNISREILQNNKAVDHIRSGITKRVLTTLSDLAKNNKEQYQIFWDQFGNVLKEGPSEDYSNVENIAKLLRFSTTQSSDETQTVSFEDYIARMQDGQDKIYYLTADSYSAAKNSPHLEIFRKKGIEVILLHDRIDEWLVAHLNEFDGKSLQSIARGDLDLSQLEDEVSEEDKKASEEAFASVIEQAKKVLDNKVKDVRISNRLTDSPACVVADEHALTEHMKRMLEAAGQTPPESQPIFELNPTHPAVKRLNSESDDAVFADWIQVLHDQAILAEGGKLDDPAGFVKRLNTLLLK